MFDLHSLVKYLLEGLAVAVAAFLIPRKTVDPKEIALIALTAAAIFSILDQFSPQVSQGTRFGSGFGIGYGLVNQVGMGYPSEGFDDGQATETFEEPTNYEGYDDYEHNEGFADTTTTTDSHKDHKDHKGHKDHMKNVCKMDGSDCGYSAEAKEHQKSEYVCYKDDDKCEAIKACQKTDDGDCDWAENAENASGVDGRTCQMKNKHCQLGKASSTTTEGFADSGDEIQGFEGFSKVF